MGGSWAERLLIGDENWEYVGNAGDFLLMGLLAGYYLLLIVL